MSHALRCLALVALCQSACLQVRYVAQASVGQLELLRAGEDIDDVLADPDTDERTRIALTEVKRVLAYAESQGLSSQGNYQNYVDLPRDQVVWFMTASDPLAFEPKVWWFPIVGSFPYLGWFEYAEAKKIRQRLEADGLDVYLRQVRAYSTGGWFQDPVLSTMITSRPDALRSLANVLFHELLHANILVNNQSTFNESLASFVGDTMALEYFIATHGEESADVAAFRHELLEYKAAGERLSDVYQQLETLYQSEATDKEKLAKKRTLLDAVERDLDMTYTPNNASLSGFKTYNVGIDEFERLYGACGRSWTRFFAAINALDADWFPEDQTDKVDDVVRRLIKKGCP